jgi:hypothetical protein
MRMRDTAEAKMATNERREKIARMIRECPPGRSYTVVADGQRMLAYVHRGQEHAVLAGWATPEGYDDDPGSVSSVFSSLAGDSHAGRIAYYAEQEDAIEDVLACDLDIQSQPLSSARVERVTTRQG